MRALLILALLVAPYTAARAQFYVQPPPAHMPSAPAQITPPPPLWHPPTVYQNVGPLLMPRGEQPFYTPPAPAQPWGR